MNNKNISLSFIALIAFLIIYPINYYYPLLADDFSYSFVFNENKRIENLFDIVTSQLNHYEIWGGRTVVHTIAQLLLMIDFRISSIFNALAYIILIYSIYRISITNSKLTIYSSISLLLLIHVFIWFLQPEFCSNAIWKTGSANYLWGSLIVIMFMYPYYNYINIRLYKESNVRAILFFLCGIVAGWTNENLGIALIMFILSTIILCKYYKIKIPKWSVIGLTGTIIGYAFMILAPGNYKRADIIIQEYNKQGLAEHDIPLYILQVAINHFQSYILPLLIIWAIALLIFLFTNRRERKNMVLNSLLFILSGLFSFFIMILSPTFPKRALFGTIILIIIAIAILVCNINLKIKYSKLTYAIAIVFMTCIFSYDYARKLITIKEVHDFWELRTTYLEDQKKKGVRDIVYRDKLKQYHSKYGFSDLSSDPHVWWNTDYARYYNINSVAVISD